MKLTTKGRYAVTAMLDLALHHDEGSVTLADISRRQGISQFYLEQLFVRLRRRGLVESVRGPGGGYSLAKLPSEISVADIVLAINENIDATRCGGKRNCQDHEPCLTHQLWEDLSTRIYEFLKKLTLGDLVDRPYVRQVAARQKARIQFTVASREMN